jgi:tetrapyrrole methylase family protein/MazG family protein
VIRNWEQIKAGERQAHGNGEKNGILDGVPAALPALLQAEQIIERVGRVGFVHLAEMGKTELLRDKLTALGGPEAGINQQILGELLLGLTSVAHEAGIDAESALREALNRFRTRFGTMEAEALAAGEKLMDLSAEVLSRRWEQVEENDQGQMA